MTTPLRIRGIAGLRELEGESLGTSSWYEIGQAEIDRFAEATGDDYWIHVDPERARDTTLGTTIAHGLFTLSLGPRCSYELYEITDVTMVLNYGFDRVRFPAPLPCGSRVRMHATLRSVEEDDRGATVRIEQVFEREGAEKPVCVALSVIRVVA